MIRFLMHIDLTQADMALFEAYEAAVLPLMPEYGGRLEQRLRSVDGALEVHFLTFESLEQRRAYLADPRRAGRQDLWTRCGAKAALVEVTSVE